MNFCELLSFLKLYFVYKLLNSEVVDKGERILM